MTTSRAELITLTNADPRFYELVGPFIGRRDVHRAVGSAVYDDADKTWLVVLIGGEVAGFLSYRGQRGSIAAESCYIARRNADGSEDPGVRMALLQKLIDITAPSPIQAMVPKAVVETYLDLGFTELPAKSTKNFVSLIRSTS
ncbi:MAG: hypothetical protein H6523_13195 [Mycolicibacterium sp.]|nr:hypothetical protein [Mycolicibacterium sp.]